MQDPANDLYYAVCVLLFHVVSTLSRTGFNLYKNYERLWYVYNLCATYKSMYTPHRICINIYSFFYYLCMCTYHM